jgi:hypothetical protein
VTYGAANIMQPSYTFAVQYKAPATTQLLAIKQQPKSGLKTNSANQGCLLYTPKQAQRLIKLLDDVSILAANAASPAMRLSKADILADLVASILALWR